MKKVVEVFYQSNEYADTPSFVEVTIDDQIIERIKEVQKVVQENGINSARIDFFADRFLDDDQKTMKWNSDIQQLIIYPESVYFSASHKHDSSNIIEADFPY